MIDQNMHAVFLALAGGYFFYIAWELLENLLSSSGDMPLAAAVAAIVLFAAAGIGVMLYAWKTWQKSKTRSIQQDDEDEEDERSGRA